jgi:Tfp pilus assembly protein PilF
MCAAASGDWAGAEHLASSALQLSEDIPNERGGAWLVVAEARAGSGSTAGADEAFREALELLAVHGSLRQHSAALRSYGRFLRDENREHEALDVFELAAEVASNLQVEPTGADR